MGRSTLRSLLLLRNHPSAFLLLAQIVSIGLYPVAGQTTGGGIALEVLGIVVIALALWVVTRSPAINWVAWLFAVPSVCLSLYATISGDGDGLPWAYALASALYFYAAGGLIAYMLNDERVTMDELFAAGATFTLLAWAFALAYAACQIWVPGSIIAAINSDAPRNWTELLFLSFTTLTNTGLGDVVPVSPPARAIGTLEMFTGLMYTVLVVSRLVSLAVAPRDTG